MKLMLVILLLSITYLTQAQTDTTSQVRKNVDFLKQISQPDGRTGGKVIIHGNPKIEKLLKLNLAINKKSHSFQGYRIQLLSKSSFSVNVDSLKMFTSRFREEFPDLPAYLQYMDPDFKIRIGNFRTRIETIPALKRVRKKYPASYPVKATIYMNELHPIPMQDTIAPALESTLFD